MLIAYFDCFSGISGDMTLGALVDLGADFGKIQETLKTLPLEGFALHRKRIQRCSIDVTQISVVVEGAEEHSHDHHHVHQPGRRHDHSPGGAPHHHESHHDHTHTRRHDHAGGHHDHFAEDAHESHHSHPAGHTHRSYQDILQIFERSGLSESVKERALQTYRWIAEAESRAHGIPLDTIHFHEVGAVDAIVDIAGVWIALDLLGVEAVWSSEVTTGFGTVETAHGRMPVPAPATARILQGVPLRRGQIESEMTTPTGAAILRVAAKGFGPWPDGFQVERTGHGAGSRTFPGQMNCLRVLLGQIPDRSTGALPSTCVDSGSLRSLRLESLCVLQTEIDDMAGEVYSHIMKGLFELGCLDATLTPVQMKKNRPGTRVEVLCSPEKREALVGFLLRETTTFGVKLRAVDRVSLDRRVETVQTPYGEARIKIGRWGAQDIKMAPEYEDCHRLALERKVGFLQVCQAVCQAFAKSATDESNHD